MKIKIFFTCLLFLSFRSSRADEATELIKKINRAYSEVKQISMSISMRAFENHSTSVPFQEIKGQYYRKENSTYSELAGLLTIKNESDIIVVNKEDKMMFVDKELRRTDSSLPLDYINKIENYSSFSIEKISDDYSKCIFFFESGKEKQWEKMEFIFSAKSYLVNSISVFFSKDNKLKEMTGISYEKPRIEILFSNIDINPVYPKNIFDSYFYYREDNNGLKAGKAFEGYEIINAKNSKQ